MAGGSLRQHAPGSKAMNINIKGEVSPNTRMGTRESGNHRQRIRGRRAVQLLTAVLIGTAAMTGTAAASSSCLHGGNHGVLWTG